MPRRHTSSPHLTEVELEELRAELAAMSRNDLEIHYKAVHNACRYVMRVPSAKLVQEFVQAWKELRNRSSLP